MADRTFPPHAVAALFLERQWLDRPRGRSLEAGTLTEFAERTGGVQIDSINVLDRAHHLTLWSRFGEYDRAALDELIYGRRVLFEYWAHAACFVPRSHAAVWRRVMADYRTQHTGWTSWLKKNGRALREVEQAVRERGPLGNADFRQAKPGGSGWWSWKPATHALHFLWMSGRLLVRERKHFQKRFDLAERILPELPDLGPPTWPDFLRWHLRQSLKALGAATETDLRMYLTFPRVKVAQRRQALDGLLRSGEVVPIAIEGDRARWLVLSEDLPALEAVDGRKPAAAGTTLLSPFDSLLWHRERVKRLFGFDYRIEVYTPGHKRVHGYYSLPIFHDGRLIGRLDAKNHRATRLLEVHRVHFEPWLVKETQPLAPHWKPLDRDRAVAGVADALASLAHFVGAESIRCGRVTPVAVAPGLASALRATGLIGRAPQSARKTVRATRGARTSRPTGSAKSASRRTLTATSRRKGARVGT